MHPPCHSEMTVAGALQQVHKCCSGLWGANRAGDGRCRQKMDFSPGNKALSMQIPLCYYLEIQPALGAGKERTDSTPWGILFWVCTRDWREAPVLPHSSGGRCQWVALVCSNGHCTGVLLFALALCLAARMLGSPNTASSWATEVCTPFTEKCDINNDESPENACLWSGSPPQDKLCRLFCKL